MNRLNLKIIISSVLFLIFLVSCTNSYQSAKKLYGQRERLLQEFRDISILKRGDNFVQVSYYKDQEVNTFFFEKIGGNWVLTNDSLQYSINKIQTFASLNYQNVSNYGMALTSELRRLLVEMKRLGINNISAEFATIGVDMKIYFGDYQALLYVSDTTRVKNERWKMYLNSGEKFDANWYYVKDER